MKNSILHKLLFFISLIISIQAGGQSNFSIKTGQSLEFDGKSMSSLFAEDSTNYYFLRTGNKGYIEFNTGEDTFIEVFDRDLNPVKSIKLQFDSTEKFKYLQPIALYENDESFLIVIKYFSVANGFVKASLMKVNKSGLVDNNFIELGEIHNLTLSQKDYPFFDFTRFYQNGELKYLSTLRTPPELEINERINFRVFDKELNLTDERLLDFPDDIFDYKFSELILGNSGLVFFSVEIKNPYFPEKTVHQLIVYDIFSDQHKTWEFSFDEGEIEASGLYEIEGDQIGFMGYYTDSSGSKKPVGLFYYIFDKFGGSLKRHKIFNLPEDEIARLNPETLGSDSDFEHLLPQAMHIAREGDALLAFEFNWDKMALLRDKEGILHKQTHYKANEIVVAHFDENDQFVNLGIVAKQQNMIHLNEHLGFFSILNNRQLFFIYNDNPKNLNVNYGHKLKITKSRFEPVIATYDIDEASYTKVPVWIKKSPCTFDPYQVIRRSPNSLLFLDIGEECRLVEMIFD
jgi:hypothetical protein